MGSAQRVAGSASQSTEHDAQTPVGDLGRFSVALFVVLAVSGVDALPLLTVNPRRLFRGQPPALVQQAVSPFRRWIPALCKNF